MASEVKVFTINLADVPRLFNLDSPMELCAQDIIAYVRGRLERNPWAPVVLDCKGQVVAEDELAGSAIFWKGINEDKVGASLGLSVYSYCVVDISELDTDKADCGLNEITAEFKSLHSIQNFSILITGPKPTSGSDVALAYDKLTEYVRSSEREDVVFPTFIMRQNKQLANGLDIDPYAIEIDKRRHNNTLDAAYLNEVLLQLKEKIDPASTVVQDLDGRRTQTIKLLMTYLCLKYNLPPVYVQSFLSEYLRFEFLYPRTKLSLYERTLFMRRIPKAVGYISANQGFHCLAAVTKKLYPAPHYVFDIDSQRIVENTGVFSLDNPELKFFDFRRMFSGSQYAINTTKSVGKTSLAAAGGTDDISADHQIVDVFTALSTLVDGEPVFLSVKNSVIVEHNRRRYLLYCPEEFGLTLHILSEYIGQHVLVLPEGDFYRLLDAQLERAVLERDRAASPSQGSKALALKWKEWDARKALQPALPLEITLFMHLLPLHRNGLSYYDKALRCSQDVLPIITSLDSKLRDVNPLFSEVSLESLRKDPQAKYAINCFGTTTTFNAQTPVVPMTYQAFEQRGLL